MKKIHAVIPVIDKRINLFYERFLLKHIENKLIESVIVICVNSKNYKYHKKKYGINESINFIGVGFNASNARNIGINWLKEKYKSSLEDHFIWFADDDCFYPSNKNILLIRDEIKKEKIILCRLKDCENDKYVGQFYPSNMPFQNLSALIYGAPSIISNLSITCNFDEDIGPGSKYFSAEDSDFLLRIFPLNKFKGKISRANLFHPLLPNNFSKLYRYGIGQGYLFRRIISGHYKIKLCSTIIFGIFLYLFRPLIGLFVSIILFRKKFIIFYFYRLKGVLIGLLDIKIK